METVVELDDDLSIKLARGMAAIATVVKLYRKYGVANGKAPVFQPKDKSIGLSRQAARLAGHRVQVGRYVCPTCQKPFIGKLAEICQCKPAVKNRQQA